MAVENPHVMFLSCSTLGGLRGNTTPQVFLVDQLRTLIRVKDAGYDCVEMYYRDVPEWVGSTVKEAVRDLQLRPYSIHLPKFLFTYPESEFLKAVDSIFPFIRDLEVKVAVLHPPNEEQILGEKTWEAWLQDLLKRSEDAGVKLAFELVPYVRGVDAFILQQIEKNKDRPLGITIDLEFMYFLGLDIERLTDTFGSHVVNIHFRDGDGTLTDGEGKRKYLLPGTGQIDLQRVVDVLKKNNYSGPLTVEVSHRNRENIVRARAFAENCLGLSPKA